MLAALAVVDTTTPMPIGPGLPEQAPSVHRSRESPDALLALAGVCAGVALLARPLEDGRAAGWASPPPPSSGTKFPARGR